jgi:hypothetical protein
MVVFNLQDLLQVMEPQYLIKGLLVDLEMEMDRFMELVEVEELEVPEELEDLDQMELVERQYYFLILLLH